jgi:Icc-related predicted phosphoesterase
MWNKIRYGRYLDIFVTHAPPWGIHDDNDPAHQGVKAFNWLIETFQPTLHIHGHIHVYRPGVTTETKVGRTLVLNTYGYRKLTLPDLAAHPRPKLRSLPQKAEDATSPNR